MEKGFLRLSTQGKEVRPLGQNQFLGKDRVSVQFLLDSIPQEFLDGIGSGLRADAWAKKLRAATLFKILLFSNLKRELLIFH